MSKYILKRLLQLIPVLIGVITIVFILNQLMPGDPARMLAGEGATEEAVERVRVEMGLDKPVIVQYINYLVGIVTRGDLGTSYKTGVPVLTEVLERLPTTMILAGISTLISVGIGVPLGIAAATWQNTLVDYAASGLSFIGVSMPNFWQGLMNILVFSVYLNWLPSSGFYGPRYWILPALTVGTSCMATITRTTRSSMLEVIRQDYIRTARAKGLTEKTVVLRYALKNAAPAVLTAVGQSFGSLITGTIVTETLFNIPGLGMLTMGSINRRDVFVIQGVVLFVTLLYVLVNLAVDILYGFVDPRLQPGRK